MPLYCFIGFDHEPHSMPLRDKARAEHRSYVKAEADPVRFATAMYDADGNQRGTMYVLEMDSIEAARRWIDAEPFYRAGVYGRSEITEVRPSHMLLQPKSWFDRK